MGNPTHIHGSRNGARSLCRFAALVALAACAVDKGSAGGRSASGHAEPQETGSPALQGTVRVTRLEVVDGQGKTRIVMDGPSGIIEMRNEEGTPMWRVYGGPSNQGETAMMDFGVGRIEGGDGYPMPRVPLYPLSLTVVGSVPTVLLRLPDATLRLDCQGLHAEK